MFAADLVRSTLANLGRDNKRINKTSEIIKRGRRAWSGHSRIIWIPVGQLVPQPGKHPGYRE